MGWHYLSIAVVLICLAVSGNVHASDLREATTRLDEGRYDEALKAYLDAASEGQPTAVRAEAEGGAGLVYFLTGRISEAEKAFRKSLGQAEAAGRRDLAARSAMNLIQVRLRQNNRSSVLPWVSGIAVQSPERADPDSLDWAESAVRYASKEQRVDLEVKARVLYARTAIGADYRARVLRELTTALERASGPEPYAEGWLLIADAAINRAYAERSDAYDQVAYRALTRVTDKDDGAIRARSMALLGRLYARSRLIGGQRLIARFQGVMRLYLFGQDLHDRAHDPSALAIGHTAGRVIPFALQGGGLPRTSSGFMPYLPGCSQIVLEVHQVVKCLATSQFCAFKSWGKCHAVKNNQRF